MQEEYWKPFSEFGDEFVKKCAANLEWKWLKTPLNIYWVKNIKSGEIARFFSEYELKRFLTNKNV